MQIWFNQKVSYNYIHYMPQWTGAEDTALLICSNENIDIIENDFKI